jgi:hypothetical protein
MHATLMTLSCVCVIRVIWFGVGGVSCVSLVFLGDWFFGVWFLCLSRLLYCGGLCLCSVVCLCLLCLLCVLWFYVFYGSMCWCLLCVLWFVVCCVFLLAFLILYGYVLLCVLFLWLYWLFLLVLYAFVYVVHSCFWFFMTVYRCSCCLSLCSLIYFFSSFSAGFGVEK